MALAEELLLGGFNARTAWKATCLVAATTNITLAGEQTIDDVAVQAGDRVLAADQTEPRDNGIYVVSTGAWTRAADFADSRSAQLGTTVIVAGGTANAGVYRLITPNTGDVKPGETETEWAFVASFDGSGGSLGTAAEGRILGRAAGAGTGSVGALTTAQQEVLIRAALAVAAGDVAVNGRKITGLADPASAQDAATKTSSEAVVTAARVLTALAGVLSSVSVNGQKITNLGTPTASTDAATKAYADSVGGGGASISDSGASVDTTGGDVAIGTGTGGNIDATADDHIHATAANEVLLSAVAGNESILLDATGLHRTSGATAVYTEVLDGSDVSFTFGDDLGLLLELIDTGNDSALFTIRAPSGVTELVDADKSYTRGLGASLSVAREILDVTSTSARRRMAGTNGTVGLTETVNSTAASLASAGTLGIETSAQSAMTIANTTATGNVTIGRLYTGVGGTPTSAMLGTFCSVNASYLLDLWSDNDIARMRAALACNLYSATGEWGFYRAADARRVVRAPADTAFSSATTTTVISLTPTARPSTYALVIHAWDASLNVAIWDVSVDAVLSGGAAVLSGSPPSTAAPTRTIGTPGSLTLTVDTSTTTVRGRVTTPDATGRTASATCTETT